MNYAEKVLTNRIYPPPGSTGIKSYSNYAGGKVFLLTYWPPQSIWGSINTQVNAQKKGANLGHRVN